MNQWEIDNLITHMAAMALYVDMFDTEISDLNNDLKLEMNKTTTYFRELGCRVGAMLEKERSRFGLNSVEAKPKRMARLQIPLEFPRISKGQRGKGR
jgi:DNA-directed RNA polymerase I subunit RPA49